VLDPAGGTLTFPAEAARLAVEEFVSKYGEGSKGKFIEDHILKHFFAFELMMAPYAAGHLKMGYLLEELGHKLSGDERFQFYLTNTLEMEELAQTSLPGMASLSEESHLAAKVKKERPILVILGNPPYSGHSANKGDWIRDQIETYKIVDGKPLGEKNPKWLQDDYVKFIRFAQWKIDQIGEGVLGFITNHSYLDNPTFRGMRQSLMSSFDEIYILDLHGNSLKKEKAPDGSKDENVFDIQQGVAIALFVKRKLSTPSKILMHSEVWGAREQKYEWLIKHEVKTTDWKELKPVSPFYLFVPRDESLSRAYETYLSLKDVLPINCLGVQTHRDGFAISFDQETLRRRIRMFLDKSLPDELIKQTFGPAFNDVASVARSRKALAGDEQWAQKIFPIQYRPFDMRWIIYHGAVVDRSRAEVMKHMMHHNIALNTMRQTKSAQWKHALVSDLMAPAVYVEIKDGSNLFPLYLYPDADRHDLFSQDEPGERVPNLAPKLIEALKSAFKKKPSPEQIFHYIYALLYSNAYRKKYAEFLKTDFPRVPFTKDYALFRKLAEKGEELVELHLLKSKKLSKPIAKCEGSGDLRVEKVAYDQNKARVHVNPEKWFTGIPPEVWEYHIGGYQVSEKWLKDRKGKVLSSEEVAHYARVVTAIGETISIQRFLDDLFAEVETSLLEVRL
jgi:predicted helicase